MAFYNNPVLVHVHRGTRVESVHRGAVVVADTKGKVVFSLGDEQQVHYPRSALKMFQALPVVAEGIAEELGLSGEETALLMASHSGEDRHTQVAANMLQKIGLSMDDLECGAHTPYHHETAFDLEKKGEQPCPLHNNCSGKHSGMLISAKKKNKGYKNYIDPSHAVQVDIVKVIEKLCGVSLGAAAVDGCSAPTFALPMVAMATGLARFGAAAGADQAACDRLFSAAVQNPYFIAGSGRHCTKVMDVLQGKVFVKTGAEGFYSVIIPHLGLGAAIKIDDGAERASQLVLNGLLYKLGLVVDSGAQEKILLELDIKSFRDLPAGKITLAENILAG